MKDLMSTMVFRKYEIYRKEGIVTATCDQNANTTKRKDVLPASRGTISIMT